MWSVVYNAVAQPSVASSSDGNKFVAVASGARISTSTDSGETWIERDSARDWFAVASSSDGIRLVALAYGEDGGQTYTSADSGVTWTKRISDERKIDYPWRSLASSSDGTKLVAVVLGGQIYTAAIYVTTTGAAGSIAGRQYDALELQYIGSNTFLVLSYAGHLAVQ